MTVLANVFSNLGLQAFGIALPRIAWNLWDQGPPVNFIRDDPAQPLLTLTGQLAGPQPAMWLAPLPGVAREYKPLDGPGDGPDLRQVGGNPEQGPGLLFTVHVQAYSRLARLYTELLEAPSNPRGIPVRPVPRYFFYTNTTNAQANAQATLEGGLNTGDQLGFFDHMRCYDNEGHAIDPLAVLAAFARIVHYYPPLLWLPGVALGAPVQNGLDALLNTAAPPPANPVHIYFTTPDGNPFDATNVIGGLAPINAAKGLFRQIGAIARIPATPGLRFGSSQSGTLAAAFAPPTLPTPAVLAIPAIPQGFAQPAALQRDFFHLRVVDHDSFLLGPPEPGFANPNNAGTLEQPALVRLDHPLTPLIGGNAVLAAAAAVVATNAIQTQVVAETIDPAFIPPSAAVATSLWPAFVAAPAGPAQLPPNLQAVVATALWVGVNGVASKDVQLTLAGLPGNVHMRVYPRDLDKVSYEERRGDGVGMLVPANGTAVLVLQDPFKLDNPNHPTTATLRFDVALVTDQPGPAGAPPASRTYGNLFANLAIANALAPAPAAPGAPTSPFLGPNEEAGVAHSKISGLALTTPAGGIGDFFDELFGVESVNPPPNPRESTRFPTMTCRELIVSDRTTAVLSGGRLAPDAWSSQTRIGAPGSAGGREVQSVGVGVTGLLAYDLARVALRRSKFLPLGLIELAGQNWNPPAAPAAGPPNTFAAAVLQNIPPIVDMPNLGYLLPDLVNYTPASYTNPATNNNIFVNWVAANLKNKVIQLPKGQSFGPVDDLANLLTTSETSTDQALVNLNLGQPALDATRQRLYKELERRLATAIYGRHDSERAIRAAFSRARRLIYIETPSLGFTNFAFDANDGLQVDPTNDLWNTLAIRLGLCPGLKIILCIPRDTDYPPAFAQHIEYEKRERSLALAKLDPHRVRVIHPVGFSGRPSRLATTTIVVDDTWALVGSSSLRRRGLRFDSSTDLVFTDGVYERGVCPALGALRRQLLAARLGIPPQDTGLPHPGFVRLLDLEESFEVVREYLDDGGYGRVDPFVPVDLPIFLEPAEARIYNPDGADVAKDTWLWAELWAREFLA